MDVKPGYKQTDVGVIPADWDVQPLNYVISSLEAGVSVNSVDEKKEVYGHDESILKTSCVIGGKFLPQEHKKILPCDIRRAKLNPRKDSIVISRMNTPALVGECGYVDRDYPDLFLPDRLWMTQHEGRRALSVRWLAYLLSSNAFNRVIKDSATGTSGSMKNISKGSFLAVHVPLPTKAEQEAIAEALNDADALIESLEQLIAKKRQIKQGVMQELLTGKKRLPGFGGEWEAKRFGEIAQPRRERIDPRRKGVQEFCIELEHIEQATGSLLGYTAVGEGSSLKSVFQRGDVLFGKLRAYLRKYWLANRGGVCSTEIWVLVGRCSLLIPQFLFQLVKTDGFAEAASSAYGTHMPRSDWSVVKNYEVHLPPIKEQTAIAAILSDMDAEIAALEANLSKARQVKQGMMQELLTGRIRLV